MKPAVPAPEPVFGSDPEVMPSDDRSDEDGDRFVVPGGVPHLAPVLEPSGGEDLREVVWVLLAAREHGDSDAERNVWTWLSSHHQDSFHLLYGLIWMAGATVRELYGTDGRHMLVKAAAVRRDSWWVDAMDLPQETVEGYLAATELVDYELRRDSNSSYDLIAHLLNTVCLTWGAVVGLADLLIEAARDKRGSSGEWIAMLRYMTTGQGQPPGIIGIPDPAADFAAELSAELDSTDAPVAPATSSPLSMTAQDCLAGSRLVTSYLCYRDARATLSEHRILDWLREHPASIGGFIIGLTDMAQLLVVTEAGDREKALHMTASIIQTLARMRPHTAQGEKHCEAELTEGFHSVAALLTARIRDDHDGQHLLLHRILQTWSLSCGAIQGLTLIAMAGLAYYDDPTEMLHDIHSRSNALTAHAEPHITASV